MLSWWRIRCADHTEERVSNTGRADPSRPKIGQRARCRPRLRDHDGRIEMGARVAVRGHSRILRPLPRRRARRVSHQVPVLLYPMSMERATILFDDDCGLCGWSLSKILAWDRHGALRPVALQSPEADDLLKVMGPERKMASWHLVTPDGRTYFGGGAVSHLARLLPAGAPIALLVRAFPGATDRSYRWVARHRDRLGRVLGERACAADPGGGHRRSTGRSQVVVSADCRPNRPRRARPMSDPGYQRAQDLDAGSARKEHSRLAAPGVGPRAYVGDGRLPIVRPGFSRVVGGGRRRDSAPSGT
jgi:predicted DCC family thiol-disulfide oxidoreductase YuxK